MRSWSYQRMQSSTGTSTSSRVRSSQCPGWTDSIFMHPKDPSAPSFLGTEHTIILSFSLQENVRIL